MRIIILNSDTYFDCYESKRMIEEARKLGVECEVIKFTELRLVFFCGESKVMYGKDALEGNTIIVRSGQTPGTPYLVMLDILAKNNHVINSSYTVDLANDKCKTLHVLAEANLPIVESVVYNDIKNHVYDFQIPFVAKPLHGMQGKGIELISNDSHLEEISGPLITQRFVSSSSGTDLRVFMLEDKYVAAMCRCNEHDFRANVALGGVVKRFEVNDEILKLCQEIMKACKAQILGIDLLFDEDGFKICEVNSAPGFEGLEQANPGVNVAQEFMSFVIEHTKKHFNAS